MPYNTDAILIIMATNTWHHFHIFIPYNLMHIQQQRWVAHVMSNECHSIRKLRWGEGFFRSPLSGKHTLVLDHSMWTINAVLCTFWSRHPNQTFEPFHSSQHTAVIGVHIYDLVPKGAHARGYALQLKIKHCWKLFLFEMLCCVPAWMNEYIVQIISATRL